MHGDSGDQADMLVRRPADGSDIAIHQEQHALISGVLAAAWRPALHPRLIAAITLHDAPWRDADATPRLDGAGRLVDFTSYPIDERLPFYRRGIGELEAVDPYVAYMVSLHYSSFAGMAKMQAFRDAEETRRERLRPLLGSLAEHAPTHLKWLQYFDVFSLHVCLTGPDVPPENLPIWLRESSRWSTTPDGRDLGFEWLDSVHLRVDPWPFANQALSIPVVAMANGESLCIELELTA